MTNSKSILTKIIQLICVAFLAKGFGFVREMVLAYFYGANSISDVYIAVQNIPAVIFTVFGTAVTTGFIPLYSELCAKDDEETADQFANNVYNIFLLLSVVLTVIGIIFSKQLVKIFAGGFTGETFSLCNQFAKIIMPTSIAIVLVYVYNAYLQIKGEFNQNSLMNIPYNLVQIIFIAIGFYLENYYLLALGLLIASFSQLVYIKILMKRNTKFVHKGYINLRDPSLVQLLILVGPIFISTGVNQINSIVDKSLASRLVEGSVSALSYSNEVANIVIQVIILSLTTILYPTMTRLFAENSVEKTCSFTEKYLNIVSIIVFPLAALMFFFAEEIIKILFGRGAFTIETVQFVSRALKVYAIGIIGASFRDVLNKVFFAMKDTMTPMVNGCITVVCNIGLNLILIGRFKYLGLAFATVIASIVCTLLMFLKMKKKMNDLNMRLIAVEFLKALVSTGIMMVVLMAISSGFYLQQIIVRCVVLGIIGAITYLLALFLLREQMLREIICHGVPKVIKR